MTACDRHQDTDINIEKLLQCIDDTGIRNTQHADGDTSGCVAKWVLNSRKPMSKMERTVESEMTYVRSRYRKIERMVSIWLQ